MMEIVYEDECNDTYGRERMHKALLLKYPDSKIPSEITVYCVMTAIGITHRPNRKPNGITKADREARKSDDLLKCKKSIISNIYIAIEKALPIELKGNAFFYALFSLLSFLTNKTEIISTNGNTQPANIPF